MVGHPIATPSHILATLNFQKPEHFSCGAADKGSDGFVS